MNEHAPKPKPPVKKPEAKQEKKPFMRKPHLTERPFRNDALEELRKSMDNTSQKGNK